MSGSDWFVVAFTVIVLAAAADAWNRRRRRRNATRERDLRGFDLPGPWPLLAPFDTAPPESPQRTTGPRHAMPRTVVIGGVTYMPETRSTLECQNRWPGGMWGDGFVPAGYYPKRFWAVDDTGTTAGPAAVIDGIASVLDDRPAPPPLNTNRLPRKAPA